MKQRSSSRRFRGFTLVELMVALAAGLIIGVSVVALSKEVTNTFHEEARVVTAESAVRTAMDRLRADLERASMMSTGNAAQDLSFAPAVQDQTAFPYPYYRGMAGIRLLTGGSEGILGTGAFASGEALLPTTAVPVPDAIEITGNLSSNADYYSVQQVVPGKAQCTGGGPRLLLSSTDAIYRLGDPATSATAVTNGLVQAFLPSTAPGATPTKQFFARVVDRNSSKIPLPQQYVIVCGAGVDPSVTPPVGYIDLDVRSTLSSGGSGADAGTAQLNLGEGMIINPVNTVRWRLAVTASNAYDANLNPTNDATKYDLIRTYLDVGGNEVGGLGNPQGEIVAEYMIDMAFTVSVDQTPPGNPDAGPQLVSIPFDGSAPAWAGPVAAVESQTTFPPAGPAPQRVRSVSIRLASRAAIADRTADLNENPPYYYRYPMGGDGGRFARVRTLMSEVFLTNQQSMTYP